MACFEWSKVHSAYIKQCVTCDEVFVGVESQPKSEAIFSKNFGMGGASNLDGLNTSCNLCRSGQAHGYVITHTQKKTLWEAQNGRCAVCGNELDYGRARIDHCHITGRIRGLLHTPCNSQLGFYEKYKDRIENYLRSANENN